MIRMRAETNKTRKSREVSLNGHLIRWGLLEYAKSRGQRPLLLRSTPTLTCIATKRATEAKRSLHRHFWEGRVTSDRVFSS